jgi:hypothetical protein
MAYPQPTSTPTKGGRVTIMLPTISSRKLKAVAIVRETRVSELVVDAVATVVKRS